MKGVNQKKLLLIVIAFLCAVIAISITFSCAKEKIVINYDCNIQAWAPPAYPDTSFSVISDTHIYDVSLGSSGSAFENAMNSDRKLLLDSQDLLDYAINEIIDSKVKFVLVCGDLTKDGELVNHRIIAEKFKKLTSAGIAVYVVPGNHDINNPGAVRYKGDTTEPVASITMNDFARIYGDYGFNSAITRDDDSLSYVTEPVEGLWLLALDTCRYRENVQGKHEVVSGKISQKTADWTASVLREAANNNKAVMAMMHHGAVEHWKGQKKLHPDYLIQEFVNFGNFLASWNVRVVFTGHYNAQDIARSKYNGKIIYDIETGSLATSPAPVRYVEIENNSFDIRTEKIIDKLYPWTDFAHNAAVFSKKAVKQEAAGVLRKFNVSESDIDIITEAVGDAFTAHYNGDENPSMRKTINKYKLSFWGSVVLGQQQYVIDGLWADLHPGDNNVRIQF